MDRTRLPSPTIRVAGIRVAAASYLTYAGAYQLTLITTVLDPVVELHSSYLGHPDSDAGVQHLELAAGREPCRVSGLRPGQDLLVEDRRACLYDHLAHLQELLGAHTGAPVTIDLADDALELVENA